MASGFFSGFFVTQPRSRPSRNRPMKFAKFAGREQCTSMRQQTFQDNPKNVLIYRPFSNTMITKIGKYSGSNICLCG